MAKYHFKKFFVILFALFFFQSGEAQDLHRKNKDLPCVNKKYNVIAHVAVDSVNRDAIWTQFQADSIIQEASKYFDPICMGFSLCEYNVMEEDYTLGYLRDEPLTLDQRFEELETKFAQIHKINIFFLDTIQERFCGHANQFGIESQEDASVFLERDCADGEAQQLAHLLGHLFGLLNTYEPSEIELVDGSNCELVADKLCDTPADPYGQVFLNPQDSAAIANLEISITSLFSYLTDCEFTHIIRDPNGEYYQPDVGNIMSAYPCKCGFTREQYLKIVEAYHSVNPKHF